MESRLPAEEGVVELVSEDETELEELDDEELPILELEEADSEEGMDEEEDTAGEAHPETRPIKVNAARNRVLFFIGENFTKQNLDKKEQQRKKEC